MEKITNNKAYGFFDWIFRLVVVNLLTILLSFLVVTILPAIVAAAKTIEQYVRGSSDNVYRLYFSNFKRYSEKSFFVWIIYLLMFGVSVYGIYFYTGFDTANFFASAGFYMMVFMILMLVFTLLHVPFVIMHFPSFSIKETVKASILIGVNNIKITLLLLLILLAGVALFPFLPVSVLIGISVPLYLSVLLTRKIYAHLERINFENRFSNRKMEDEQDDDDGN
jgi:uncharacterized membrane protein YesL